MGEFNLNLSTRPFPAYRVANLALLLFFFVVAGASVWQAYAFRDYSAPAKSLREQQQTEQVEKARLGITVDKLGANLDRPVTAAKLAEIDFLNNLIVRKHFSWTEVFSNLESVIPETVHLTSVAPEISKSFVSLKLQTVCRSHSDEAEFIRRLQASPVFADVIVTHEEEKESGNTKDVVVTMSVSYFPERAAGETVSPERASSK